MKSWGYSLLLSLLRSLIYVKRGFLAVFRGVSQIIAPVGRFIGRYGIFPVYATIVRITKRRSRMRERYGAFKGMVQVKGTGWLNLVLVITVCGMFFFESRVFAGEPVRGTAPLALALNQNVYNEVEFGEVVEEEIAGSVYTPIAGGRAVIAPFGTLGVIASDSSAQRDRTKIISYVVEKGDTLGSIAQKYSISLTTVLWENKLTAKSSLAIGDVIRILPFDGVTYKVGKGDTVGSIGKKFDVEGEKIIASNTISNAQVFVGEILVIPGAKPLPSAIAVIPKNGTKPKNASVVQPPVSVPRASETGTRLVWPTSGRVITQYFGGKHTGVDIDGDYSSPIYASEDGVVVKSGWNANGYGEYVVIDHGGGMQTLYGHTSKRFVAVGDTVTRGQVIAMVGTTGHSTGTHLHYEVRINNKRLNPLSFTR